MVQSLETRTENGRYCRILRTQCHGAVRSRSVVQSEMNLRPAHTRSFTATLRHPATPVVMHRLIKARIHASWDDD